MPQCRTCKKSFDGAYRCRYCSDQCRLYGRTERLENGCLIWLGGKTAAGYGVLNLGGKDAGNINKLAHRLSYLLAYGEYDQSQFVCHRCDNPSCVEPSHLFLGTHQDNMGDMAQKGRAAWAKRRMPAEVRKKIGDARRASDWSPSPEHRRRVSEAMKNEWASGRREGMSERFSGENNPNFGKTWTPEQRAKLEAYHASRRGLKGRPHSEDTKEKQRAAALRFQEAKRQDQRSQQ